MIYVYTSILNGWDNLRALAVEPDFNVGYICFTNLPQQPYVGPWEIRPLYDVGEPCRTARVPKILPHLMLPDDCEFSIYHDGNLQLKKQPAQMIAELMGEHSWAAHRHPCRTCIYQEADVILRHESMFGWREQNPERSPKIKAEIGRYWNESYPEHAGLWANGMIVRRHTPEIARLNERWWKLYSEGGERDQLSFPVARMAEGLIVNTIDGVISGNSPYVNFYFHAAWKDKEGGREFHPERDRIRTKLARLKDVTGSDGGVRYPEF